MDDSNFEEYRQINPEQDQSPVLHKFHAEPGFPFQWAISKLRNSSQNFTGLTAFLLLSPSKINFEGETLCEKVLLPIWYGSVDGERPLEGAGLTADGRYLVSKNYQRIESEVWGGFGRAYNKLNSEDQKDAPVQEGVPSRVLVGLHDHRQKVQGTVHAWGRTLCEPLRVKMAINMNNNEKVAIKIMKTSAKSMPNLLDAFINEVSILANLEHRHVVHLKDFEINGLSQKRNGRCKRVVYYAMSLAENGELYRLIDHTDAFSERLARHYFRQLIEGVEYLHEAGFAHRDIKAENILLDVNYRLKIADFGFACAYMDPSSHQRLPIDPNGRAVGSPQTNAPEITNCSHEYFGDDVDVFAIGCVLFYMVMKTLPFKSSNFKDQCYSRFLGEDKGDFWKIFAGIAKPTKQFKDLIERLLNPDPKRRIKLVDIKKHEWFKGELPSKAEFTKEVQYRFKKVGNIIKNERQAFIKSKLKAGEPLPKFCGDPDETAPFETPRELLQKVALLKTKIHDSDSDGSSSDRRTNEDKRERYQPQEE